MGEAVADFMALKYGPIVAGTVGGLALLIALVLQFRARQYVAWIYWLAVAMVSVFGTMGADGLHIEFHLPYLYSTIFYSVCLTVIFVVWYLTEKTLSIHSIYTWRREAFYWATVLATFALGTAVGDLTATTMHLGYLASGILFTVIILIPAAAYRWLGMNAVFAFWFAYVITRPLGASFADWMGVAHAYGGLGWGRGVVGFSLAVVIAGFVAYVQIARPDVETHVPSHSRKHVRRPDSA